jgi:molybdopterin biosynthesis enzyme
MSKRLLTYEEAKRTIEQNFKRPSLGQEEVVLLEAYNRVLSENVVSPLDIPGFNSSRVAGYAVKSADTAVATEEEPIGLKVAGVVNVGETSKLTLNNGEAFEVTVGAVLPEGADAVIAIEDAQREDDTLQVYGTANVGDNMRKQGSDVKAGAVVLEKGQVLGSSEIGVLAAIGLKQAPVLRIPMVTVLSVSNEVSELNKPLQPGKSFDLNGYSLSTAAMECGAKPVYFGVVAEDKTLVSRMVSAAVAGSDLVIICSDNPVVAETIGLLPSAKVAVDGIAIKPGKTTAAVFVEGKPVFIFPSNPSAALLMYQLFARTLVQQLAGRPVAGLRAVSAVTGAKMFSAKGSRTYTAVQLSFDEKCRVIADPVESQGVVSALVSADGFVEIAENEQFIEVDQEITVWLLRGLATKA